MIKMESTTGEVAREEASGLEGEKEESVPL